MSDVFEEVEEGLRQDRFSTFMKKYGMFVAAGVVAVLLGIGGYQAYGVWRVNQSGAASEEMDKAQTLLAAKKDAEAEKALTDIAAKGSAGYKTSALMQLGAMKSRQGDNAAALKFYDQAAAASPTSQFREVAQMQAAYLAADIEDFAKLEARLKPIIDGAGPFSSLARELIALQAAANGDVDRAREEFEFLTLALDAPEGVRQRAQGALSALGPKPAGAEPADAPKPASTIAGEKK